MSSKVQIVNVALRLLHVQRITADNLTDEDNEQSAIINDVYDIILDEVLAVHPWNFAIKRAELTEIGGTMTGWEETSGQTDIWEVALTTQPGEVDFDGTEGTEKTSVAACTSARDWYWESNVLYMYSTSDPDTVYTTIHARIAEFKWERAYGLPTDNLRVITTEGDVDFAIEGTTLYTNEDGSKIKYIAQITTTTNFSAWFITTFAARLAAELAMPLTENGTTAETMYKLYKEKIKMGKGMDAQEGTAVKEETLSWEESRG